MAIAAGADALGLVGDMPSGPGIIAKGLARTIAEAIPPPIATFLLTSHETPDEIAEHVRLCGTSVVQIVRHIDPDHYPELVRSIPRTRRVQVIHVEDEGALDLIPAYSPHIHAFLLDSGRPTAEHIELGGTGRTHNWDISAEFVRRSEKPVFLAGGLNADNVAEAIRIVAPYGVDLCTGVRTDGGLDSMKLESFMHAVHSAS